jgi:hypothetical protein
MDFHFLQIFTCPPGSISPQPSAVTACLPSTYSVLETNLVADAMPAPFEADQLLSERIILAKGKRGRQRKYQSGDGKWGIKIIGVTPMVRKWRNALLVRVIDRRRRSVSTSQ